MKRLLITGGEGFTGRHLSSLAKQSGFEVVPFKVDLTHPDLVSEAVYKAAPTHVCHLAAISAITHSDQEAFYRVNLFGTTREDNFLRWDREFY